MRDSNWFPVVLIAGVFSFVILLGFSVGVGLEYWRYKNLQALGYEVKYINLNCYAKYHKRWIVCEVVERNQMQLIVNDEEK